MINSHKHDAYKATNTMTRKTQQVVMLYDGAIRYLQQAKAAIGEQDHETKFNLLNKAQDILCGMKASLDFESGGEVAKLLEDYYAGIDMCIYEVHRSSDVERLETVIRHIKMMRDAWIDVDRDQHEAGNDDVYDPKIADALKNVDDAEAEDDAKLSVTI